MSRDYHVERDAIIRRWYGNNPQPRNPRPCRDWAGGPITPADCLGIPMQVNSPFRPFGHCMVWKYGLNRDGYGTLTVEGKQVLAHRAAFIQTRGYIPEGMQVNHLCNRPYCVQPSHLYAGTTQDNKDDSLIFGRERLLHAPWILLSPGRTEINDPLLLRLLESNRYDGTEPWQPVVQPAQMPLEEFNCPQHDFAITMFSGETKICRICEVSEVEEETLDEFGTPSLIAEICPASQTVLSILEKIVASGFVEESHRETRQRAYHRSRQGFGVGSHDLRTCVCDYCARDRAVFRAAIRSQLTTEESALLDICDRLEPHITAILEEASGGMTEEWGKAARLSDEQAQALKRHHKDCANTKAELVRASRALEGEFGFLLYAISTFNNREDILEDETFRLIMSRWSFIRVRQEDEKPIQDTILLAVDEAVNKMALAWERETDEMTKPYLESKPELHQGVRLLAQLLARKRVFEHLRYELLGRNSFGEQYPHPHSYCAASIRATGRVQRFPREFEEGIGYMLGARQIPRVPATHASRLALPSPSAVASAVVDKQVKAVIWPRGLVLPQVRPANLRHDSPG
ncbi:MAG: HNH endonuclease [Chloroflexi bacterium]|nr:HNH endonuclease [Chloroflexota bacterium]